MSYKMVELSAKGVVEVSEYGIKVDGADVLKELAKQFEEKTNGRRGFAGVVKILIIDETEPLNVVDLSEKIVECLNDGKVGQFLDKIIADVLEEITEDDGPEDEGNDSPGYNE